MQNIFKTGSVLASGYTIVQIRQRADGRYVVLATDNNTQFATWFGEINEERQTISLLEGNYFGVPKMLFDYGRYCESLRKAVDDFLERLA